MIAVASYNQARCLELCEREMEDEMSGFTPGPWSIEDGTDIMAERDQGSEIIATTYGFYDESDQYNDTPETFANAALIVSAPTMYEALLSASLALGFSGKKQQAMALQADARRKVNAALKAARGGE